jgi:excisionase family DNA binding protein
MRKRRKTPVKQDEEILVQSTPERTQPPRNSDLMDITEICAYLRLNKKTAYKLLAEGLPHRRIGRRFVTTRNAISKWIESSISNGGGNNQHSNEDLLVKAIEKGDNKAQTALFKGGNLRIRSGKGD